MASTISLLTAFSSKQKSYNLLKMVKEICGGQKSSSIRFYGKLGNGLGGLSLWCDYSNRLCKVYCSSFGKKGFSTGSTKSALHIELIPCLKDNYAYLLHDPLSGVTGVIDPSEPGPVINVLKKKDLNLIYIINTHHHWDHTGGNIELKKMYSAKVVGHAADKDRIPGIDVALHSGQVWMFGNEEMHVLDTPGHTCGHICLYFPNRNAVFTGDTLFSLSCGKLFEGTPEQMFNSVTKIASFPDDTEIYCGHEYTLSSAKFAVAMEPGNKELAAYFEKVKELRSKGHSTIPSTIGREKSCNPFLRLSSLEIKRSLAIADTASEVQTLAALRGAKDKW